MAIESIAKTLGSGSGIDIPTLVQDLVDAQFANKAAALNKREEVLTAQISAASELKSGVAAFDGALKTLIKSGSLSTQPVSGNSGIVKVTALAGATITGLNASIEVRQLASSQVASAAPVSDKTAAIGTGTLTLRFGTATVASGEMTGFTPAGAPIEIAIGSANSSLQGIANAINAKNAGVTASILSDSDGHRLVLKGATGEAQAFTLTATEDVGAEGLAALNIGVGATGTSIGTAARDAVVALDGVAVKRASNAIQDLIAGVRVDLVSASTGTQVAIGSQAPTQSVGAAVSDFVDTYNELLALVKKATDAVTGPLRTDPAAKALLRSLGGLTVANLVPGAAADTPATLAAIGVGTNRDGTLKIDTLKLASALVAHPGNLEAMFKDGAGISKALSEIATVAADRTLGLGASEARYAKAQDSVEADQEKALAAAESLRTRMTRQFAGMDAAVARYKSTQTFLENQVKAWNSEN